MTESAQNQGPWAAIDSHDVGRLDELFNGDPERLSRLSFDIAGIHFDWSKTHLDAELIAKFELAGAGLYRKRDACFRARSQ